jgi:hypothetical protein
MLMDDDRDRRSDRLPVSRLFHQRFIAYNHLDDKDFKEWVLHPAMLFGSNHKWWDDFGERNTAHEGLDLCCYRTNDGDIQYLNESTKVPVIFAGRVVEVCSDFLGESVFVSHDIYNSNKRRLHTIYGHIKPGDNVCPGARLNEGDIIGILSNKRKSSGVIPYHLHISIAWLSETLSPEKPGWQMLNDVNRALLIDPLSIIEFPCSISSDVW